MRRGETVLAFSRSVGNRTASRLGSSAGVHRERPGAPPQPPRQHPWETVSTPGSYYHLIRPLVASSRHATSFPSNPRFLQSRETKNRAHISAALKRAETDARFFRCTRGQIKCVLETSRSDYDRKDHVRTKNVVNRPEFTWKTWLHPGGA